MQDMPSRVACLHFHKIKIWDIILCVPRQLIDTPSRQPLVCWSFSIARCVDHHPYPIRKWYWPRRKSLAAKFCPWAIFWPFLQNKIHQFALFSRVSHPNSMVYFFLNSKSRKLSKNRNLNCFTKKIAKHFMVANQELIRCAKVSALWGNYGSLKFSLLTTIHVMLVGGNYKWIWSNGLIRCQPIFIDTNVVAKNVS